MHVYFSGIGGAGIGPLAQVAKQAGYDVSGSDKQASSYIDYLRSEGIHNIHVGQSRQQIEAVHANQPIDWLVYTSALPLEQPDAPELKFCREQGIKISKRDEFLNQIISDKEMKMIAVAGTHGKTTTTAMLVWLAKRSGLEASYILPAKTKFADMGHYHPNSRYFIYECDEFDRNFLAFKPAISLITGVSWDHHEIYPTREDYQAAFREFIGQSGRTVLWQEDFDYLQLDDAPVNLLVQQSDNQLIDLLKLKGKFNRLDAWLAIQAIHLASKQPLAELMKIMNNFPGLQRRMEEIAPNLYSDYAHTPEKIRGAMSVVTEMAARKKQNVIVVYEPLTNRRQHYMLDDYGSCFDGASKVYWIPSYLAREDPKQRVIAPAELIEHLADPSIAQPAEMGPKLKAIIKMHLESGDIVVGMAGGGGKSLDDWLRKEFK